MHLIKPESAIEAILFVSGEAIEIKDIADAVELDVKTTEKLIENLKNKYVSENRGMNIINIEDKVQMCTSSEYFTYIQKMVGNVRKRKNLTPPMLETLAIIAYKQPVTKTEIEKIRGVNPDHAVNKLIEYELVEEKGRLDTPGKPIIFGTTDAFLTHFGLKSINNLPELIEPESDDIEDNEIKTET